MRVYTEEVRSSKTTMDMVEEIIVAMPTTSKVEEAGRLPSIEMEPKTLTLDQIKDAREAALFVVSTKTEEEAIRIFTAGLKPVEVNSNVRKSSSVVDSSDDDVDLDGSATSNTGGRSAGSKGGRRSRRRHSSMMRDDDIRDIATAPF